jgi:hypothetical protein
MLPCAKANTGISGAIIAIDRAPVRSNGETAAKYDILESRSQEMENQLSFSGRRQSCTHGYGGVVICRESAFSTKRHIDDYL